MTTNRLGTYTFNSLEDLEDNRPSIFTRTLSPRIRNGTSVNSAVYMGDTWRQSRSLQLTYGARLERSQFNGAPAYNPAVEQLFGYRTDEIPTDVRVSPRVGFTWALGGAGTGGGFGAGGFGGGGPGGGRRGGGGGAAGGGNGARPNATAAQSTPVIIRGGIRRVPERHPDIALLGRTERDRAVAIRIAALLHWRVRSGAELGQSVG